MHYNFQKKTQLIHSLLQKKRSVVFIKKLSFLTLQDTLYFIVYKWYVKYYMSENIVYPKFPSPKI